MVDVATSCRTCMKNSQDCNLVDIFQPLKLEDCSLQLAEALKECTSAEVTKDDGLPQKLCTDCVDLLHTCYTFRNRALNAQNELKRLLEFQLKYELELKSDSDFGDTIDNVLSFENYDFEAEKQEYSGVYACNHCDKKFTSHEKLLKHVLLHNCPLACYICNKSYKTKSSLEKHLLKHSRHQCTMCKVKFDSEEVLLNHIKTHLANIDIKIEPEELPFKCEICEKAFAKRRSLAMHKKMHKVRDKVKFDSLICDICNKELSTKSLMKRHLKLHSMCKKFGCTKCPKSYSRQDQLVQHMNLHEGIKRNTCPHCNKSFSQLCSLKDHLRTHTRECPFLCSQCGKTFSNSSNLRQHMMRHTGLKPYSCGLCPKTFSTKGQMTYHLSTHTGAHPYTCESCGAAFTKPNSLKKHQLIHLGVRPYDCDECPKTFRCKDHLKRHYRIHTGEKPYKCKYCERAFTQSNDLVKHTRSHVGQNVYECTFCDMRFRLLSELKQHYPIHYIDGEPPLIPVTKQHAARVLDPKAIETIETERRRVEANMKLNMNPTINDLQQPINHKHLNPVLNQEDLIKENNCQDFATKAMEPKLPPIIIKTFSLNNDVVAKCGITGNSITISLSPEKT